MNTVPQIYTTNTVNTTPQITTSSIRNPSTFTQNNPRRSNRVAMNLNSQSTDRRNIVSFRQLEVDTSRQVQEKRKTQRKTQLQNNLSPEQLAEKERRKTIRQSMRKEEAEIEMQMHKFVQEMASIEEKMQQERKLNEELTENYNELLDILIVTVTNLEDLIPTFFSLKQSPNGTNFADYESQFAVFRQNVYKAIGEVHRNQAKERLDLEKRRPSNVPPPPMAPPPPSLQKAKGPAVNLLSEIHKGVNLKKVDNDRVRVEHDNLIQKSVTTLTDLQNILSKALEQRSVAILGDDEDDWEDDEDW